MDFKNIIELISRSNINQEAMYELVSEASTLDLNDEEKIVMHAAIRCNGFYCHGYSGVGVGDTDYSRDK